MQPSRRAFLMGGRRSAGGQWGRFYSRLSRVASGRVSDTTTAGTPGALLVAADPGDVQHARALCAELDVRLVLAGCRVAAQGPVLTVDVSALQGLTPDGEGNWRAEPGVKIAALRQRLPAACPGADCDISVGQWWLGPAGALSLAGLQASGVASAEITFADGAPESLGAFGVDSRKVLSPAASRLVAGLFTLANQPEYLAWRSLPDWPAIYRLDVLWSVVPNLAWLLAGSRGTLAWLDTLIFEPERSTGQPAQPSAAPGGPATELDDAVKQLFDSRGVFARLPA